MTDTKNVEIDDISAKHRKERKELQATIQSLKKSASKGDKKKRKEVLEEIAKLEIDIEKRQSNELNDLNNVKNIEKHDDTISESITTTTTEENDISLVVDDESAVVDDADSVNPHRISKAQKRRDKKVREQKEREVEILAQEELNKNGPRMLESRTIAKLLKDRNLSLHIIQSDGDCLYNAVRHQLELTGRGNYKVSQLRNETANYILANKDNLIFYMTNLNTGDILSDAEFEKYCQAIRDTPAWGGQIEIKALSNVLKVPIEVIQATGPPTIQGHDEYSKPNLVLTYHRLMYSLGEHYNSTKLYVDSETVEDGCGGDGDA